MVIKRDNNTRSALQARASDLLTSSVDIQPAEPPEGVAPSMDPVEAEKLAKRAARFADVTGPIPTVAENSAVEAEKLAKRIARFGLTH